MSVQQKQADPPAPEEQEATPPEVGQGPAEPREQPAAHQPQYICRHRNQPSWYD